MFTEAVNIIKSNKLHIRPSKLGIRYTSSMKYPILNKEKQNMERQITPKMRTIGLNQRMLEVIDVINVNHVETHSALDE